jgi:hypothetical protein
MEKRFIVFVLSKTKVGVEYVLAAAARQTEKAGNAIGFHQKLRLGTYAPYILLLPILEYNELHPA